MRDQLENRSGAARRQNDLEHLLLVEFDQRSNEERRAPPSDDDIDESEMTLENEYWPVFM